MQSGVRTRVRGGVGGVGDFRALPGVRLRQVHLNFGRMMPAPLCGVAWCLLLLLLGGDGGTAKAPDWLRSRMPAALHPASATTSRDGARLTLTNGLVSRTFALSPNFATVDLSLEQGDQGAGQTFIRGLSPEAKLFLQGIGEPISVGGLAGEARFLLWYPQTVNLTADPTAFQYVSHELSKPVARFDWRPQRFSDNASWPPSGVHLAVHFKPPVSNSSSALTERDGYQVECQPDQSGAISCLTGHAQCDNSTVSGQCTLPWASAVAVCRSWAECRAVSCAAGRGKPCQARSHTKATPAPGGKKPPFWRHFIDKGLLYQDRLGTNIGESTQKRLPFSDRNCVRQTSATIPLLTAPGHGALRNLRRPASDDKVGRSSQLCNVRPAIPQHCNH
jgi:hypothetical protein